MELNNQLIDDKIHSNIFKIFNLSIDKAEDEVVDCNIRTGIEMKGTNLWILICAIIIASIGLNINSIAIIIGAMLISPLMGPIMGIGYGVGIYDFPLIRNSLKHLGLSVFISLCASVLYFSISPLTQAQSELLARTTPTIWDAVIAFFGGLAGIIGATRKERYNVINVIPGVAIATSLMPPLCTAGFELINGNWVLVGDALYLFTINSVFIALASALIVRIFHIEKKQFIDLKLAAHVKRLTMLIVLLTIIPSIYLAYNLVQNELFKINANKFIDQEISSSKNHIAQIKIDPKTKLIEATVIGDFITSGRSNEISKQLTRFGLSDAKLLIYQPNNQQQTDVYALKSGLLSDLYANTQRILEEKEKQIEELQKSIDIQYNDQEKIKNIPDELHALFPQIFHVLISNAISWNKNSGVDNDRVLILNLQTSAPILYKDQEKIKAWVYARLKLSKIKLIIDYSEKKTT